MVENLFVENTNELIKSAIKLTTLDYYSTKKNNPNSNYSNNNGIYTINDAFKGIDSYCTSRFWNASAYPCTIIQPSFIEFKNGFTITNQITITSGYESGFHGQTEFICFKKISNKE